MKKSAFDPAVVSDDMDQQLKSRSCSHDTGCGQSTSDPVVDSPFFTNNEQ